MEKTDLYKQIHDQIPLFDQFRHDLQRCGLTTWLVGGCVRDLLLGRDCTDIDVVSSEDPSAWARNWAKGKGYWFWLDEQRKQSRILLADGISFDFAPLRAATITDDLKARDYTINAIAISINEPDHLLDPLGGVADLHTQRLKMCSVGSFSDDPLRILKGIRHAAVLNFTIEDQTIAAMAQQGQLLKQVAVERIREELLKILAVRDISYPLQILSRTAMLQVLFGPPDAHWSEKGYAATHQSLVDRVDAFRDQQLLDTSMGLLKHRPVYHLAALLNAYAPLRFAQIYPELRLSRAEQRLLNALREDLPDLWLQQLHQLSSARQRALAVEQLEPCGVERVFYHGWCRRQLDEVVISLLAAYEQQREGDRIPDLIDGHGMALYAGSNNRGIGELLQRVKLLEICGEIHTREDALKWLRGHFGFDKN